jgi:uncharacterized membrane protein YphA (DoxX/SURF4 family)
MEETVWHTLTLAVAATARLVLGTVYLLSAVPKLRDRSAFVQAVAGYRILPSNWTIPFAYGLLWSELLVGTLLVAGWQTRLAAAASGLLLATFIAAIAINLARGRQDLDCGCQGSKHTQKIGWRLIGRDLTLLGLSLMGIVYGGGFLALDRLGTEFQAMLLHDYLAGYVLPGLLTGVGIYLAWQLYGRFVLLMTLEYKEV